MSLMKKMAKLMMKLASDGVDYSKTYKDIYLSNDGEPIYSDILGDLLDAAEVVKKKEETEKHYRDESVGHSFAGIVTEGSITAEAPLGKVAMDEYEDEFEGLLSYVDKKEAIEVIKEEMQNVIGCEGELDKMNISFEIDTDRNIVVFSCEYGCTLKDE